MCDIIVISFLRCKAIYSRSLQKHYFQLEDTLVQDGKFHLNGCYDFFSIALSVLRFSYDCIYIMAFPSFEVAIPE